MSEQDILEHLNELRRQIDLIEEYINNMLSNEDQEELPASGAW